MMPKIPNIVSSHKLHILITSHIFFSLNLCFLLILWEQFPLLSWPSNLIQAGKWHTWLNTVHYNKQTCITVFQYNFTITSVGIVWHADGWLDLICFISLSEKRNPLMVSCVECFLFKPGSLCWIYKNTVAKQTPLWSSASFEKKE